MKIPDWDSLDTALADCRLCPRLTAWREEVAQVKRKAYRDWTYWGKPVPGFGDRSGRILVVGLAPGAHGSNRTGRMFTGDASGVFLFSALHKAGFANQAEASQMGDGLKLRDLYITAVCRCAPPDNKPTPEEMLTCQPYLQAEISLMQNLQGIVALGAIGFNGVLNAYRGLGYTLPALAFGHGAAYELGGGLPWLLASYHPSRQNTQTGRLTVAMFDEIWTACREKIAKNTSRNL